jgi:hypothetical protein
MMLHILHFSFLGFRLFTRFLASTFKSAGQVDALICLCLCICGTPSARLRVDVSDITFVPRAR